MYHCYSKHEKNERIAINSYVEMYNEGTEFEFNVGIETPITDGDVENSIDSVMNDFFSYTKKVFNSMTEKAREVFDIIGLTENDFCFIVNVDTKNNIYRLWCGYNKRENIDNEQFFNPYIQKLIDNNFIKTK